MPQQHWGKPDLLFPKIYLHKSLVNLSHWKNRLETNPNTEEKMSIPFIVLQKLGSSGCFKRTPQKKIKRKKFPQGKINQLWVFLQAMLFILNTLTKVSYSEAKQLLRWVLRVYTCLDYLLYQFSSSSDTISSNFFILHARNPPPLSFVDENVYSILLDGIPNSLTTQIHPW